MAMITILAMTVKAMNTFLAKTTAALFSMSYRWLNTIFLLTRPVLQALTHRERGIAVFANDVFRTAPKNRDFSEFRNCSEYSSSNDSRRVAPSKSSQTEIGKDRNNTSRFFNLRRSTLDIAEYRLLAQTPAVQM